MKRRRGPLMLRNRELARVTFGRFRFMAKPVVRGQICTRILHDDVCRESLPKKESTTLTWSQASESEMDYHFSAGRGIRTHVWLPQLLAEGQGVSNSYDW